MLKRIEDVINNILDENSELITEDTRLIDIEGWDSLSMIQVVVGLEKEFKIKFKSMEYVSWINISDIIESIKSK